MHIPRAWAIRRPRGTSGAGTRRSRSGFSLQSHYLPGDLEARSRASSSTTINRRYDETFQNLMLLIVYFGRCQSSFCNEKDQCYSIRNCQLTGNIVKAQP